MKKKALLVTGAAGFLGSHLCEWHLKKGYIVIGVDNFCTGLKKNVHFLKKQCFGQNFYFVKANVIKPWTWIQKIPQINLLNFETIYHFASPAAPFEYQRLGLETMWVNTIGLSHALKFADAKLAKVIFASTSEIYGDPHCHPQPETYWGHVNSYGIRSCYDEAKRFGEALIFTHNKKFKTRHGLVRIFNTYGPRMNPVNDGRVIINFLTQALLSKPLTIYGDGKQTRSFCYVDDLIKGIISYRKMDAVDPLNLGNDQEYSILELVTFIKKCFSNQKIETKFIKLPLDDPKQRKPDLSQAFKKLSWCPKVQLEQGLLKMKNWLLEA